MAYNQKTQDKKDIQILKQVEIIISDIRAYLKEGHTVNYDGEFMAMIEKVNAGEAGKLSLDDFSPLFKFYSDDELKNKALINFTTFFKRIIDARAVKKDILVTRYENYLKAMEYLKHAFYFYPDDNETIQDKFYINIDTNKYYEDNGLSPFENEINISFSSFQNWAELYFKDFKKLKKEYDMHTNKQTIK
ncbi:hypothetical protein, partial [uncultured Campylobacter sp.]|uniref:hypothetical protein n=1 Tax=uncultured Campylobacter sp. TaxID=218934 RepID=UPI002613AFFB